MIRAFRKDIVSLVAYLIGVSKPNLINNYIDEDNPGLFDELDSKKEMRIIRSLCKIRTSFMNNFRNINHQMTYEFMNISSMSYFSADDINQLEEWGIKVLLYNQRGNKYLVEINKLISDNICNCKDAFPPWLEWEYIKELFIMPKGNNEDAVKAESNKYLNIKMLYPFKMYINWNPDNYGNILHNDRKFLSIIYSQHGGKCYFDQEKVLDASEDIKKNIYDFIGENKSVAIVVDCENSDVYKLYAVLKNLNQDELNKIKKIILYDDVHTTNTWTLLSRFIGIEVQYIEVERINDNKSLVDIKMTAGICSEFYGNNVKSFILVSSDSDFWGVISSLPDAEFLIMYEYDKCGKDIKEAMRKNNIPYCPIDDFCSGNIEDLKNKALLDELEYFLENILTFNGKKLLDDIYTTCRIHASETEKNKFYDKYIKSLRLSADIDGEFKIKIRDRI